MLYDVALGAITKGVNKPTWVVINVAVLLLWLTLAGLLYLSFTNSELAWLVPHSAAMLGLCTILGALVNWFIASQGLTSAEEQEQSLIMSQEDPDQEAVEGQHSDLDEETREKLRNLPLQSDIDIGISGAGGFDTSGLAIQTMSGSDIFAVDPKNKDKGA